MNRFALLPTLCLLAGLSVAHASSYGPLSDGYGLTVGSTTLNQTNTTVDPLSGVLSFSDGLSNYTFAEVNASPLVNALSITRVCVLVNLSGCQSSTITISDASLLNGTLALSAAAQVSAHLSGSAVASVGATTSNGTTGISTLTFVGTSATLGLQTAVVGTQSDPFPVNSPVPEPGTISLVLSGALGVAAAARRRLLGA
ncbi:PEP-CTERM sorting domain-containing protein [Terriglobus aquaticus]|uniref:PEP-CTERM sorting domain-containing protein n=1 Tax=Terriglobus aquaticus TaxID=940139 RepID=A0ABW9KHT8_9BACT|nr:PEP-CTERM sorting domain-containing protein [Terriglobus aquaticus]